MSVLLLGGQRLRPRRAEEAGYVWRQPTLAGALGQLLARR
jgi:NAD dependent epimerase/dehydratase family enzyme